MIITLYDPHQAFKDIAKTSTAQSNTSGSAKLPVKFILQDSGN